MSRVRSVLASASPSPVKIVLALLIAVLGFTLCRRAIVLSDEGYLLAEASELLNGAALYRDLDSFVAPGVWFLLAGLFAVVEPSVLASRAPALMCYLAMIFVVYRIVRATTHEGYALAAVVAGAVFTVWTFPAWTFSFYSPYSALFALVGLERLVAWTTARRVPDAFLAAVGFAMSIAFKQNFGAFALVGGALTVVVVTIGTSRTFAKAAGEILVAALAMFAGVLLVAVPFVAYFVAHDALAEAYYSLFVAPFSDFATQHTIPYLGPGELLHNRLLVGTRRLIYGAYPLTNTTFLMSSGPLLTSLVAQLHVIMYLFPPVLFTTAVGLLVMQRRGATIDAQLVAVVAVCGLLFLGVFPRADYNHLGHVYQPILVAAPVVAHRLRRALLGISNDAAAAVPVLALAALVPYGAVAVDWYFGLLHTHDSRIVHARGGVLVDTFSAQMIDFEVAAIRERTAEREPVLTLPGLSMLNFIADRPMPSQYYNLYAVHIAHDQGAGVAEGAERENVQWVVAEYNDFFSDAAGLRTFAPKLAEYVRRTYAPAFSVATDRHMFMQRRPQPLADSEPVGVAEHCNLEADPFATRSARSHLLFDSVYHRLVGRRLEGRYLVETLCDLHVPAGAKLYGMFGYRQPQEARPGSTVRILAWALPAALVDSDDVLLPDALDDGSIAPVLDRTLEVAGSTDWAAPPPEEFRVDLSGVAGRDVLLVLRTVFEGEVEVNAFDFQGFAMVVHDLRFERAGSGY